MEYFILGVGPGGMGEAIAARLVREDNSRVIITDKNTQGLAMSAVKLHQMPHGKNSEITQFNPGGKGLDVVKDNDYLHVMFKGSDVVVNALPASFNVGIAKAVILANQQLAKYSKARTNYLDLGGVLRITEKILSFEFKELAMELEFSLVPESGFQPGNGCIHVVDMYNKFFDEGALMPLESAIIYVGGLPKLSPYYKPLFNLKGLEEIYYHRPLVISRGKLVKKKKLLAGYEEFSSGKFGFYFGEKDGLPMEAAVTGGLGALPFYMVGLVKKLEEKTLRWKGHFGFVQNIPKNNFIPEMRKHYKQNPELKDDFCLLHIEMIGAGKNGGEKIKAERTIYVESDQDWNSMQKTTGFAAADIAILIAEGKAKPGAYPPERALDAEAALNKINKDLPVIQEYITPLE